MRVEVVFAQPRRQLAVEVCLAEGACIQDALDAAAADARFCDIDPAAYAVGVYGQVCERDKPLQPGDRVEIYRELRLDAKTARRQRAALQQNHKQD